MDNRIVSIQLMRALACLLVLMVHTIYFNPHTINQLNGAIGVDIFFVISGFIIAASVERLPEKRHVHTFLVNRFSRVAPYYYLWSLAFVALATLLSLKHYNLGEVIKSFLFYPQGKGKDPVHPVGWSLNHEIFFYLFVALALFFSRSMKHIAALFLLLLVTIQFIPSQANLVKEVRASINVEFFFGMAIYLLRDKLVPVFKHLSWLIAASLLVLVVMRISIDVPLTDKMIALDPVNGYSRDTIFLWRWPITVPRGLIYGIPSALLFIAILAQEYRLKNLRSSNLFFKIGNASFTIYLIQHMFFLVLDYYHVSNLLLLAASFATTVGLSLLIFKLEGYMARGAKKLLTGNFQRKRSSMPQY